MGYFIRVKSGIYTFSLDGKHIYMQLDGSLNQKFNILPRETEKLTPQEHIGLVDLIYKRKITDTSSFNEFIFSKYRLVSTERVLR